MDKNLTWGSSKVRDPDRYVRKCSHEPILQSGCAAPRKSHHKHQEYLWMRYAKS